MSIEIDQLNSRLVDAETKLKTEIQRIRKKMMVTITELEMTLDVANKNNIDLQKTIKKQSLQLTVSCVATVAYSRILCHSNDFFPLNIRNFNQCTRKLSVNYKSPWISMAWLNVVCKLCNKNWKRCALIWKLYEKSNEIIFAVAC